MEQGKDKNQFTIEELKAITGKPFKREYKHTHVWESDYEMDEYIYHLEEAVKKLKGPTLLRSTQTGKHWPT